MLHIIVYTRMQIETGPSYSLRTSRQNCLKGKERLIRWYIGFIVFLVELDLSRLQGRSSCLLLGGHMSCEIVI